MTVHPYLAHPALTRWPSAALEYSIDRWQRTILFGDIMRQRGNNYLSHLRAGQPPALAFEYEPILDAMDFDPPVNYALVRILERRTEDKDRRQRARKDKSRREQPAVSSYKKAKTSLRPLVVIDPRAGHGPGIGGSKLESQIGVALEYGHPVYFIMFSTDPAPGQTIAAVQQAEIRFLEEVGRRHADAPKPAVIGNCQAGWAAALIGADRPDVVGPMVLNGSPLSYWGGVEGANPMRYKGGLCGGIWLSTLWSDLGNGHFDGAHLVAGFEDLNPTNTYWSKPYHLFTNVDTETERFLNFEKWWGGFFKLSAHEIHFITSSLFVGNELEKGLVELQQGRPVNLKNFKDPIFVFASRGDNITPPPQALNWIVKVYGSTEEIKHQGQVIIYMVHENIGHLGIFVSGRVAAKEHREIIGCLEMMPYLAPGLYEMVITDDARNPEISDYAVRFEEREMSDILKLDDGLADENAFVPVAALSQFNDAFYRVWVQPWVRSIANPWLADWLRQMHPLRFQRYAWSDLNPLSWIFYFWSLPVKHERRPASPQNPFVAAETIFSLLLTATLGYLSNTRDLFQEWLFKSVYASPWLKFCLGSQATDQKMSVKSDEVALQHREKDFALQNAGQGEFAEAVIRIILAVAGADRILEKSQFDAAEKIIRHHHRFRDQTPATIRQMVADQARILSADINLALAGLALILTTHPERLEAFDIAIKIAVADFRVDFKETTLLTEIRRVLELDHDD